MTVLFGVKSTNLEESARWVEQAIGLSAEPRESISFGGDYYGFSGLHGEIVRSPLTKSLIADAQHFQML